MFFSNTSTAGNATLIANGVSNGGQGGGIFFANQSDGGTASVTANGNGYFDISGLSTAGMNIGSIAGSGNFYLGGKTLTVGGNNLSTVVSGAIQDGGNYGGSGGAIIKTGAGTLTLSGANTYTGATTVSGGTLRVNGSLYAAGTVTVGDPANLGAAAILAGDGTVGNVTMGAASGNTGAEVEPGDGVTEATGEGARLTVSSFTIGGASQAVLALQIGRTSPGNLSSGDSSDRILTTGAVSLDSSANLVLSLQTGYTPAVGDIMYLIVGDSSNPNQFGYVNGVAISGGQFTLDGDKFDITNAASASDGQFTGGFDEAVKAVSVVPEPSTWAMLAGGFGSLLLFRRRR